MQGDHEGGRALGGGNGGDELVHRIAQDGETAVRRGAQVRIGVSGDAHFEHRGVIGGLLAGEGEIGAAECLERRGGVGAAGAPGGFQGFGELVEAAAGKLGEQGFGVAEMTIRGGGTDADKTGGLGQSETGRTLVCNEGEGGFDKSLTQIAVVVAASPGA